MKGKKSSSIAFNLRLYGRLEISFTNERGQEVALLEFSRARGEDLMIDARSPASKGRPSLIVETSKPTGFKQERFIAEYPGRDEAIEIKDGRRLLLSIDILGDGRALEQVSFNLFYGLKRAPYCFTVWNDGPGAGEDHVK